MRTTIHLALAVGAMSLLASCAQESIISREYDPDQIAYKAFANNATKSGAVDNDHLGNIGDLYISAIKLNDAGYYFSNNIISGGNVSSSIANSGNTPYHWPTYKLGFYAANRSMTVTESNSAKLTPSIDNFTVSRRALNDPDELMVALEAQQRDGNGTPVQLGLHHALSRLTIQVQKTIPGYDISVAGVQIGGFKSVGTFTFPQYNTTNATSDSDWSGLVSANYGDANSLHTCWSSLGSPLQYGTLSLDNDALSGTAMTSTAQNIMGAAYFYVIPQGVTLTTAASGSSPDITDHWIDLLVNVKAHDSGAQIYPSSSNEDEYAVARVYIPTSQTFEAGKSYTVTLNFCTGLGVSMSNLSLYNGSSSDLSSSLDSENFVKNVSSDFPDNTFILGSGMDYNGDVDVDQDYSVSPAALPGLFTVDASGTQVRFSKGNLRCYIDASGTPSADPSNPANTTGWAFADHQYDYIGNAVANTSIGTTAGWIDYFGWSTDSGTKAWGINNSTNSGDYSGDFVDWGTNQIYNDTYMDPANTWYTPSRDDYVYLCNTRNSVTVHGVANARYARGTVASKAGLILFPDSWVSGSELSEAMQNKVGTAIIKNAGSGDFSSAVITADEWLDFEAAGCVFLPAAGIRSGSGLMRVGDFGYYWDSVSISAYYATHLYFSYSGVSPASNASCFYGFSVRLVQNVE